MALHNPVAKMDGAVASADGNPSREKPDWRLREWRRLGLWLPVCLGIGIAWYFALSGPTQAMPWLVAALCGFAAALAGYAGLKQLRYRAAFLAIFLLGMAMGAVGLGAGLAALRLPRIATPMLARSLEQATLSGVIEDVLVQPDSLKLTLGQLRIDDLNPHELPARIRITTRRYQMEPVPAEKAAAGSKTLQARFDIGDRVILQAGLFPAPGPASPGQFDHARYFFLQGIGAVGFSNSKITVLKRAATAEGWEGRLARFRLHLSERIRQRIAADPERKAEGAVAISLMTGQQSAIPREVTDAMRVSGLSHILSISGLHLALASGIVFVVLRLLLLGTLPARGRDAGAKKIAALLALLAAFAYLAVAGFPVAAQRSTIMVGMVLLAVMFDRQALGMRSLALAAGLLLLWQPESLLSASFQLSFAATAAIIAWAEVSSGWLLRFRANEAWPAWLRTLLLYVGVSLMTSFVASLITAPLIMVSFQTFNSYGLLANLLVSPLVTFWIMPMVVLTFLALPFGLEALPLQGLGWGLHQMILIAERMAALPHASLSTPSLPPLALALTVAGGLWLLLWRTGWLRTMGLVGILCGLILAFRAPTPEILIGREGKQVAARLPDGAWRMLLGGTRNLTAKQLLEAAGQAEYAGPQRAAGGEATQDPYCAAAACRWENDTGFVLLRFDSRAPRAYYPRTPKKPDSELTEKELKKRLASRAKSAAKRAAREDARRNTLSGSLRDAEKQMQALKEGDLLLDARTEADRIETTALRIDQAAMHAANGMSLWRESGRWHMRTVRAEQGNWPWAISRMKVATEPGK